MTPCYVIWIDAFADAHGWCELDQLEPVPRVISTADWLLGPGVQAAHLVGGDEDNVTFEVTSRTHTAGTVTGARRWSSTPPSCRWWRRVPSARSR